jgi:hypothetical protein
VCRTLVSLSVSLFRLSVATNALERVTKTRLSLSTWLHDLLILAFSSSGDWKPSVRRIC